MDDEEELQRLLDGLGLGGMETDAEDDGVPARLSDLDELGDDW